LVEIEKWRKNTEKGRAYKKAPPATSVFQKRIHPSDRRLGVFLQIDLEVVRSVWCQVSSLSLAEHILEFVVFFRNVGKIGRFNFGGEGGSRCGIGIGS